MTEKKEVDRILTPEGRLINASLFIKDQYNEEATPSYKLEMAFELNALNDIEDKLAAYAVERWGAGSDKLYDDGTIISPIIDGDVLAARREEKGKPGDAYKGKLVIRAHTIWNKHGRNETGGVGVYGDDGVEMEAVQSAAIYSGCYGYGLLTINDYVETKTQKKALMFYLAGFQKTRDGEPLVSSFDFSTVFKPIGRTADAAASEGGGRRSRAG